MRRHRSRRGNWRLLATLIGVGLALAFGPCAGDPAPDHEPARRPSDVPASTVEPSTEADGDGQAAGPGPRSSIGGVGVGFERSEQGALAAALSYATAAQAWLYLGDEQLEHAADAVVAPSERARLVESLIEDVRLLRDQLDDSTGVVWYVVSPLATKVDSYSDDRASVRVWIVRVLSADGVAVPQAGWSTLNLDLLWESDDWRVADVAETDGPTPQLEAGAQPWDPAYLDETLAGFTRVGVAS